MKTLGKYRLVAELARGGMGIVWLAEMLGPGGFSKTCVVKQLLPELASDPHHRAMFLDEASLAARLTHKNIVQTNEVGSEGASLFMALELLEGCTLRRAQDVMKKLPTALAVRIVCEVLDALDHAHELRDRETGESLGIVHRDVTPLNVFLTFDGQVKLLDFGIAKSRARREHTREGFAKGCIAYMSPDHVAATGAIDRRADIFAAGILLRELLTGRRMWEDTDDDQVIVRRLILHDVPAFPIISGGSSSPVPAALRRICETAMAPRRSDRFATASHMREALEWWLACEDPHGSLRDLVALFDDDDNNNPDGLSAEKARVLDRHRIRKHVVVPPPLPKSPPTFAWKPQLKLQVKKAPPPPPRPPSSSPTPILLPSTELMTSVDLPLPVVVPVTSKLRRLPKRELFVAVMAIVASIAAAVSVAGTDGPDERSSVAREIVVVTPSVAAKSSDPTP